MSRTLQFSWPLPVLQGLADALARVLTEGGHDVTAEDVRAEMERPEEERGSAGRVITLALRGLWEDGDLFFGPDSLLVYSYGKAGLREEMRGMPPSHAARRRARQVLRDAIHRHAGG